MLTRSRHRKRYSRVKLLLLTVLFLMLLFATLGVWYVNVVTADEKQIERNAIAQSSKMVAWTSITNVNKSVWDAVYYVVEGIDESGETQFAWVGNDNQLTVKKASEGATKQQIKQLLVDQYPGISIKHIIPGIKDNVYVWQALVNRKDENGNKRFFYHFFHFENGTPTGEIFSMPNQ